MQNISKTQLKITDVELAGFRIHPEIEKFVKQPDSNWHFNLSVDKWTRTNEKRKKFDELKSTTKLSLLSPDQEEELIYVNTVTCFTTKQLFRKDVDADFWEFLVRLSLAHSSAYLTYKCIGTPLQGSFMRVLPADEIMKDVDVKLKDIWG